MKNIDVEGNGKYTRYVDVLSKEELAELFATVESTERWFTGKELDLFSPSRNMQSLGARYLVKKRIRDEIGKISPLQLEILRDEFGKPILNFDDKSRSKLTEKGIREVLCSLSHSRRYVSAMTVFCYEEP